MFETLRRRPRSAPPPCLHPQIAFDWYRGSGIATCETCGEVFLASSEQMGTDWIAITPVGATDDS